jgi:hypothetical protein
MLPPVDNNARSVSGSSLESIKPSYSPQQKAVDSVMREVDRTIHPPKSLRLRLWSKIAAHISQAKAKFLSKLILNSRIVARDNVAPFAQWISSRYIGSISPEQIAKISPERMAQLDRHQIFAMTPEQIAKLDKKQLAAMNPDDHEIFSKKINALSFIEFVNLCNSAENPVEIFKMRSSSVKEKLEYISKDELFVASNAKFQSDMTRAHLVIGDEDIPVVQESDYKPIQSTKEAAEERRFAKIEAKLKNLVGEEGFAHLQSFAHQGIMPPILSAFIFSFSPGMVEGRAHKFQFNMEDGIVKIQVTVNWKVASEDEWKKDKPNQAKIAKFTTETNMTLPLEDLQRGDFSHATAQTVM